MKENRNIDEKKLETLHNASELLDAKYGAPGTESRREFEERHVLIIMA